MGRQTSYWTLGFCRHQHGNAGLNPCLQNVVHRLQHQYLQAPAQTSGTRICTLTRSCALCTVKPAKAWCEWRTRERRRPRGTRWDTLETEGFCLQPCPWSALRDPEAVWPHPTLELLVSWAFICGSINSEGIFIIRCPVTSLQTGRNAGNPVVSGLRFFAGRDLHLYLHLQSQEPGPPPPAPEKLSWGHQPAHPPSANSGLVTWLPKILLVSACGNWSRETVRPLAHLRCVVGESSDSRGARPSSTAYLAVWPWQVTSPLWAPRPWLSCSPLYLQHLAHIRHRITENMFEAWMNILSKLCNEDNNSFYLIELLRQFVNLGQEGARHVVDTQYGPLLQYKLGGPVQTTEGVL